MRASHPFGRMLCLMAVGLLLAQTCWADGPARAKPATKTESGKSSNKTSAAPNEPAAAPDPATRPATPPAATEEENNPAFRFALPQGPRGTSQPGQAEESPWAPMPASAGGLGLLTQETGELLPQKGYSSTIYLNRFAREPGNLTVLNIGWTFAVGLHDRINAMIQFEPFRHIHVSRGNQLSFNAPTTNPGFGSTIYRSLIPVTGAAPSYVEDYPFASGNSDGVGEVIIGLRFAISQERLGHPWNVSILGDFVIPTQTTLVDLLNHPVQLGTFGYAFGLAASKTWRDLFLTTVNGTYRFTRNHEFGTGTKAFIAADQIRVGAGFLVFPNRRWQLINEYNALLFVGDSTPTTSFGPRAPLDGIWGARLYLAPWENVAVDLGYRFALNLRSHGDRSGFVVKLSAASARERRSSAENRRPVAECLVARHSVEADSAQAVRVTMRAHDPDGDTLSFTWRSSGGLVVGTGPEVSWNPAGLSAGIYTVRGRAEDGRGGAAACAADIRVEPRAAASKP